LNIPHQTASISKDQVQVDALKKRVAELEKVGRDFGAFGGLKGCMLVLTCPTETLKKQAKQQGYEYDRLTGELQKLSGSSDKRKD
jgi:hypothetical protein